MKTPTITSTTHEINEWQRLAHAAYKAGKTGTGNTFSVAAAVHPAGQPMPLERFDYLQATYRRWLCFGFSTSDV